MNALLSAQRNGGARAQRRPAITERRFTVALMARRLRLRKRAICWRCPAKPRVKNTAEVRPMVGGVVHIHSAHGRLFQTRHANKQWLNRYMVCLCRKCWLAIRAQRGHERCRPYTLYKQKSPSYPRHCHCLYAPVTGTRRDAAAAASRYSARWQYAALSPNRAKTDIERIKRYVCAKSVCVCVKKKRYVCKKCVCAKR